jgi:hypothetical protein
MGAARLCTLWNEADVDIDYRLPSYLPSVTPQKHGVMVMYYNVILIGLVLGITSRLAFENRDEWIAVEDHADYYFPDKCPRHPRDWIVKSQASLICWGSVGAPLPRSRARCNAVILRSERRVKVQLLATLSS